MKWLKHDDDSSNLEDRRGRISAPKKLLSGGIIGIVIVVISVLLGKDPSSMLQMADTITGGMGTGQQTETIDKDRINENEELKEFTLRVFNSCNEVWTNIFNNEIGETYQKPKLVIFTDQTTSGCGAASSAMGPFYCPSDTKVYIDLNFFHELANRFKAPGDLAMAYVTAHEVGHHVQHLLGITNKLHSMHGKISQTEYNKMSVKLELQADFFGGLWAHYASKMGIIALEDGDLDSAIKAAQAIGDDALQKAAQGYVVPDSFTHGTSAQRVKWFRLGYIEGKFQLGDTFSKNEL